MCHEIRDAYICKRPRCGRIVRQESRQGGTCEEAAGGRWGSCRRPPVVIRRSIATGHGMFCERHQRWARGLAILYQQVSWEQQIQNQPQQGQGQAQTTVLPQQQQHQRQQQMQIQPQPQPRPQPQQNLLPQAQQQQQDQQQQQQLPVYGPPTLREMQQIRREEQDASNAQFATWSQRQRQNYRQNMDEGERTHQPRGA